MTTKETWKPVTIGGLSGILMGAGAMYGLQADASEGNNQNLNANNGIKVATVDDSMSFGEAFAAARSQIGAGGVFKWHGNIFNTYTAEEWKAMSNDDKNLFAERVKPELSAADVNTKQLAENAKEEVKVEETESSYDDNVRIETKQNHDTDINHNNDAKMQTTTWDELAKGDDVRVLGYKDVEIAPGKSVTVQGLEINGQRVAVIDVDKDGDPDLAMADLNHNQEMDYGEVIDLHTGEAVAFTNDDPTIDNVPDIDTYTA